MSSPTKTNRPITVATAAPHSNTSINDIQDDFQAYQMRPVIKEFKLSAELFASNGDVVLICGKGNQAKQDMLLVSYEIPPTATSSPASIKLLKVIKLTKKSVTQLETIPILKLALLLGDGVVGLYDIDSLAEISTVPTTSVILFSTW